MRVRTCGSFTCVGVRVGRASGASQAPCCYANQLALTRRSVSRLQQQNQKRFPNLFHTCATAESVHVENVAGARSDGDCKRAIPS